MKILILGAGGMLGSAIFRILPEYGHEVYGTLRHIKQSDFILKSFRNSQNLIYNLDVLNKDSLNQVITQIKPHVIINCIGIIKQLNISDDPLYVLPINSLFPHKLSQLCLKFNARLIHISSDCVFDGKSGNYLETDKPNADDLYGKSKELGEIKDKSHAITIRTSIIGHELYSNHSLVDWFLSQTKEIKGYKKAIFSGLTNVEISKVIHKYILPNINLFGLYHLSVNPISKFDLLSIINKVYNRSISIVPENEIKIDRSLNSTKFQSQTDYKIPSWDSLIGEMKSYYDLYKEIKDV